MLGYRIREAIKINQQDYLGFIQRVNQNFPNFAKTITKTVEIDLTKNINFPNTLGEPFPNNTD